MKALRKFNDSFEEVILVIFLIAISLIMGVQIVARVFFTPLTWSEEAARFLLVWSGFLSISYCFHKQISIKIEQLVEMLPTRVNAACKLVEKIIMLAFYIYMIKFAYTYFNNAVTSGQLSPAMQLPMAIIQFAPLLGFVLSVIRLLQGIVEKSLILVRGEPTNPELEA